MKFSSLLLLATTGLLSTTPAVHGIEPLSLNKRIVGGTAITTTKYNFAVRLNIKSGTSDYLCGGTLLADDLVVTAGHCMHNADTNTVYSSTSVAVCYGSPNVSEMSCTTARNIFLHPSYNPLTYANDIALIQISQLKSGFDILPVYTGKVPESTVLTTMGWGKTVDTSTKLPPTLMAVDIMVGGAATCKKAESSFVNSDGPEICSVNSLTPGKDSCQGDSGSPAIITADDGKTYLVGLTSAGVDLKDPTAATCATANGIAFYTHINYFMSFITAKSGRPASFFYGQGEEDNGDISSSKSKSAASRSVVVSGGALVAAIAAAIVF
ncbi:hypothetical protein LPJ66_006116 [Kickxella alabastrina]|uniref:Uncharacterized protein n=1 Tax=Kickxella alabastrina TaxID=61397 RepID=A0ACC1IEY5_9FUNG|nr:hypothetical protein LPJ66_006116 [Kickxella alabastrina]